MVETQLIIETLGKTIRAHIDKADKYLDKAEQHYKSAGLHLIEAKARVLRTPGLTWPVFLASHCGVQRSRADELIAIAEGRATVESIRASNRERATRHRARSPSPLRNGNSPGKAQADQWGDAERKAWRKRIDALLDQADLDQLKEAARVIRELIEGRSYEISAPSGRVNTIDFGT